MKIAFAGISIVAIILLYKLLLIPNYYECLAKGFSRGYCIQHNLIR